MREVVKLGRYECSIGTIGYVYADSVEEAVTLSDVAAYHEVEGSCIIHVESVIDTLENLDELEEDDEKLLSLCKAAKAQGLGDIIINPK